MPATLHLTLREDWRGLKRGRPGRRFLEHYQRSRRGAAARGLAQRALVIGCAGLAFALGAFFAVFPGPALPFFFLAGALLASESRLVARGMDALEVRLRRVLAWAKRRWRRLPLAARVAAAMGGVAASAGVTCFFYRLLR